MASQKNRYSEFRVAIDTIATHPLLINFQLQSGRRLF